MRKLSRAHRRGNRPIRYLFIDNFITDRAAGAVNGTPTEPAGDVRAAVDTGSQLTLSAGEALFAGTGTTSDPRLSYSGIVASAGLCFFAEIRQSQDATENIAMRAGFDGATTGAIDAESFDLNVSAALSARWASASLQSIGNYVKLTNYQIVVLYTATQAFWLIKGGTWTDWTSVYSRAVTRVTGGTTLYPGITSYNRGGACTKLGCAILPAPFNNDSLTLGGSEKSTLNRLFF